MPKVTMHIGKKYSRDHNLRAYAELKKPWNLDGHIDSERTFKNEIICDESFKDFYSDLMKDVIEEFNSKQKNLERKTTVEAEYKKVLEKKQSYEAIFQIGKEGEAILRYDGTPMTDDDYKKMFRTILNDFQRQNPNLVVFGAYIHMDETTPHMHVDYLPVSHSSRGMSIKTTLEGALKEMGFERGKGRNDTAQMRHTAAYRDHLEELVGNYVKDIEKHEKCTVKHKEKWEYEDEQAKKKLDETTEELTAAESKLDIKQEEIKKADEQIDTKKKSIKELEEKEKYLSEKDAESIGKKALSKLEKLGQSYVKVNLTESEATSLKNGLASYEKIVKRENKLKEREKHITDKEAEFDIRKREYVQQALPEEIKHIKNNNREIQRENENLKKQIEYRDSIIQKLRQLIEALLRFLFHDLLRQHYERMPEQFDFKGYNYGGLEFTKAATEMVNRTIHDVKEETERNVPERHYHRR